MKFGRSASDIIVGSQLWLLDTMTVVYFYRQAIRRKDCFSASSCIVLSARGPRTPIFGASRVRALMAVIPRNRNDSVYQESAELSILPEV